MLACEKWPRFPKETTCKRGKDASMATGWSNYQVTQGYMEWFYDIKFAVVSLIALGFAWYSISRVITALKTTPPQESPPRTGTDTGDEGPDQKG
jgi:hypothetical protein